MGDPAPSARSMSSLRLPKSTAKNATGGGPRAWSPALPLAVYGALAAFAVGFALARGVSPISTEPWVTLPPALAALASVGLGLTLALATVLATRVMVQRFEFARALHLALRPAVRHLDDLTIVLLALGSGVAEELVFRGALTTTVGLVASSLAFGLLHQVRGRGRWLWAGWATVMGLLFGALFLLTGSLLGPIAAHAAINVANLRFLRDTDVEPPKPRRLGGLLGRA